MKIIIYLDIIIAVKKIIETEISAMTYTLKNNILTVEIDSLGAQILSVKKDGCEYIWQGNPEFWAGRTPLLFPICGRLFEGRYFYEGKEYQMNLHGFVRALELNVVSATDTEISFSLCQNEQTLAMYPFDFEFVVSYTLDGDKIRSHVEIKNTGDKVLPATFGAHPGFNVPLDGGAFDDYYLEFSEDCTPDELIFSDTCFNTGKKKAMELIDGNKLPLRHSLFDVDAIFMDRIAPAVTLKSDKSQRSVTVKYADMPYLGIWHKPRTSAPYVCIEPWCGLPSFDGQVDDMSTKCDMFHIPAGKCKSISYEIIFK